jgi:hypothetical protein
LSGAKLTQCRLAAVGSVTQCFSQRGVNTEPGQKVGVENPIFNVRFDMYQAGMKSRKTDPDYPAAANVIKGIVPKGGSSCIGNSSNPSTDTVGLPRDDCFASGTCPQTRFGDGNWSAGRTNYWKTNYGGTTDPFPAATTRYEYYLAEIAASGGGASSTPILTGRDETGRPHCSPNQTPDPGRRILIAAGIDCAANPINGRTDGVPVKEFVKLFLTEPVGDDPGAPSTIEIWAEIAGSAQAGGAGANGPAGATFHDVVQLYR